MKKIDAEHLQTLEVSKRKERGVIWNMVTQVPWNWMSTKAA